LLHYLYPVESRLLLLSRTEAVQLVFFFSFSLLIWMLLLAAPLLLHTVRLVTCFFVRNFFCQQFSVVREVYRDNRGRRNKIRSAFATVHATIGEVNDLLARISLFRLLLRGKKKTGTWITLGHINGPVQQKRERSNVQSAFAVVTFFSHQLNFLRVFSTVQGCGSGSTCICLWALMYSNSVHIHNATMYTNT